MQASIEGVSTRTKHQDPFNFLLGLLLVIVSKGLCDSFNALLGVAYDNQSQIFYQP